MADFSSDDLIKTVLNSTQQSGQLLTQGAAQLGATTDHAEALLNSSAEALKNLTEQQKLLQVGSADISFQQSKVAENLQSLYNMNPDAQSNEISDNLALANQARSARRETRAEYDRLNSVDFLSNPLGYLVAQAQIPTVARKNNALADAEDDALNEIAVRTNLLAASKNTVVANTADAVRQQSLNAADVNAQMANAKLDQEQANNLVRISSSRMQQMQILDKVNDNQRSAVGVIASIQNAQETRRLREDQSQDRELDRALRRETMEEMLKKKKEQAAQEADLNGRLSTVSQSLGLVTPMTMDRLRSLTDKKTQEMWLGAASTGRYGEDLENSVVFYQKYGSQPEIVAKGGASVISTAKKLDQGGAGYEGTVTAAYRAANPTAKGLTRDQSRGLAYDAYQTDLAQSTGNPATQNDLSSSKWDKTFNPYVAPLTSFSKAIDTTPELAGLKNNIVKKQIDTLAAAGVVKGDNLTADQQKQVIDSIQTQVLAKVVTPAKAAADISQFFKSASDFNLAANKYNLFSLPAQTSYLFSTTDGGRTDLFDPTKVEHTLIKGVKAGAADRAFGSTPFGFR